MASAFAQNPQDSFAKEFMKYVQFLQETQQSYLQYQADISREMITLHRGFGKLPSQDFAVSSIPCCEKILAHQQRLHTLQQNFLEILQEGFTGFTVLASSVAGALHQETVEMPNLSDATSPVKKSSAESSLSTARKRNSFLQTRTTNIAPLPIPFLVKMEAPEVTEKSEAKPGSEKMPMNAKSMWHNSERGLPEEKSSTRRIRPRHRLELFFFKALQRWGGQASEESLIRLRKLLAFFLYHGGLRRNVVDTNLAWAYPELKPTRRRRIARGSYDWGVRFALDVIRMGSLQGMMAEWSRFENLELLDEALEKKRGVLLIGAHLGNWEVLCPALSEQGYSTSMYVGAQTNPLTDELQNETRRKWGIQTIGKGKRATMQMWDALKDNRAVGMLIDQDERKSGVFVEFFGKAASTNTGAAAFHLMHNSPILLFSCPYVGKHVKIRFRRLTFQSSGNGGQDLRDLTQQVVSGLELMIRRHPEQYFWMHRRWRKRPPGDSGTPY